MNTMNFKVTKGSKEFLNQIFHIERLEEMIYIDKISGLKILDTWEEIQEISKYPNEKFFFDMHLMVELENNLKFIEEIELVK